MTADDSPQESPVPLEGGGAWVPPPPAPAGGPEQPTPDWPAAAPPPAAGAGWAPPPPFGPPPAAGSNPSGPRPAGIPPFSLPPAAGPGPSAPPGPPPAGFPPFGPPPSTGWWGPGAGGVNQPPSHSPGPPHRVARAAAAAALAAAAGLAGVAIGHAAWPQRASAAASESQGSSPQGQSPFGSGGIGDSPFNFGSGGNSSNGNSGSSGSTSETSAIAAKISPAVVDINSTFGYQSTQGAGTGIVLTSNGEVLTNNHVINGATRITATDVGNGQTYTATVLGYDASHDVALLQLHGASGLRTAHLADSSKVNVGQSVVAVGNAGGTGGTPSNAGGSVTALHQSITAADQLDGVAEHLTGLIQVNADIQPGDSGGPLVNTAGQVIGIDTAASQGFTFQTSGSQGFAIPINQALSIANQIRSGQGTTTTHVGSTAFLGVGLSTSSGQGGAGDFFGGSGQTIPGAVVSGVLNGGPAAQAGLAQGDTITSLDGHSVTAASDVSAVLVGHHPGDQVQIGWVDSSGQSHTATVVLGSGPPA